MEEIENMYTTSMHKANHNSATKFSSTTPTKREQEAGQEETHTITEHTL
jgi:hypothetical protein